MGVEEVTIGIIKVENERCFSTVIYKGTYNNFVDNVMDRKYIKVYEDGQEWYINTNKIIYFSLD